MTQDEWNDGETPPTAPGWYVIQICWDVEEGIHLFVVEIPGAEWGNFKAREPKWHGPHPTEAAAMEWRWANDPDGPL